MWCKKGSFYQVGRYKHGWAGRWYNIEQRKVNKRIISYLKDWIDKKTIIKSSI